ncbi:MAG TPA: DUF2384 domain-containing protein [Pseudomonas xinjiangensis]|uniref:DUF2384 domain-containing protein n=2 Tax=root TaxID=1 RepID=A0A7V1BKS9_9GAMM|nr:DUF2384 domain-containing protein [Halopseudomonas xinjiangensis]HEC48292.1 DUF2384 domain-containing protein [Halopseudomonas xinjiangensis]
MQVLDIPSEFTAALRRHANLYFWDIAEEVGAWNDADRLKVIRLGYPSAFITMLSAELKLPRHELSPILNLSSSSIERRVKDGKRLDAVASERIDRFLQVALLAKEVFEDSQVATKWLITPNHSLGGERPFSLCDTELGAKQVRRVLHAIEWGNAA